MTPIELFEEACHHNLIAYEMSYPHSFGDKLIYQMKYIMWERFRDNLDKILVNENTHFYNPILNKAHYFWESDIVIDNVRCKGVKEDWTKMYKADELCFPSYTDKVCLGIGELGNVIFGAYYLGDTSE